MKSRGWLVLVPGVIAASACGDEAEGPPVRLVAGVSDTVIVNNARPIRLPVRVLDGNGRTLPDTAVRYEWISGTPMPVNVAGLTQCAQSGDAKVRASLGVLTTEFVVLCRPVTKVHSMRMMNLLAGGPAQDLPFTAVDAAGEPVTLLSGRVAIEDSTVATLDGARVSGRAPGCTWIDMRIGERLAHASVHVYEKVDSPRNLLPGEHIAVPVRLASGEVRRWRLRAAPELYFITVIPDGEPYRAPWVAVTAAACSPGLETQSYFCLVRQDAEVVVSHPANSSSNEARGMIAIWRQESP